MTKQYRILSSIYIGYGLFFLFMGCLLRSPIFWIALSMLGAGTCNFLFPKHRNTPLFLVTQLFNLAALAGNIWGSFTEPEVFIVPAVIQAALVYFSVRTIKLPPPDDNK